MMDLDTVTSSSCYGVRRLFLPQTAKIVIAVLSALVISINLLAMISVLRNYRRLRQRIYVFVINLAVANILAGAIFFTDVMVRYFVADKQQQTDESINDDVMFTAENKYIKLKVNGEDILSQELLETFKAGVVVLSVLNTALVTFALYKRTTSMGRHHEDFRNVNGTVGPDGHSFLPAFDTMMRVLSIGSPAAANGLSGKNLGKVGKNGDYSPSRRTSSSSRISSSPQRNFSFTKESDGVLLDKYRNEQNPGIRNPRVVRVSLDNATRKSSYQSEKLGKRSGSVSRLMSTGRRVSHAIRSRSVSGTQPYVGRHSYSVMSKSATTYSLAFIWILFAATWGVPLVLRKAGITGVVCPGKCRNVEVIEMMKSGYEQMNIQDAEGLLSDVNRQSILKASSSTMNDTDDQQINVSVTTAASSNWVISPDVTTNSNDTNLQNRDHLVSGFAVHSDIGNCAPANYEYVSNRKNQNDVTSSLRIIGSATMIEKSQNTNIDDSKPTRGNPNPACSSCSAAFFPLSKSHMIFIAMMIFITWCWLIVSASRLLYLRKHSNNVFVRCSALWRFMFMNAIFFFFSMAPYMIWIIMDFVTGSPVPKSPLWYSSNFQHGENNNAAMVARDKDAELVMDSEMRFETMFEDVNNLHPVYAVFATCLILINFAVAPSLYLIRLLGFRRIISALHLRS